MTKKSPQLCDFFRNNGLPHHHHHYHQFPDDLMASLCEDGGEGETSQAGPNNSYPVKIQIQILVRGRRLGNLCTGIIFSLGSPKSWCLLWALWAGETGTGIVEERDPVPGPNILLGICNNICQEETVAMCATYLSGGNNYLLQ